MQQPTGDRQRLLQARNVSKSFGAFRVLHDVDFDVYRGEVLGILGPNGAGKTTLFNMISGDLKPSGGEIRLGEVLLKGEPPHRRCQMGIGRTYQIPQPYSGMTTFENLLVASAFGGGRSEAESYDFCAQVLSDCELLNKANKETALKAAFGSFLGF
ncbi:MAG: ABC transporter ATP-binding protein, partial [Martelella sp.]|uniref:ATP-binding cassette domain-containing protein n=1 Tax=Martelella sp. TaxID=1969699 RepID=UPI000C5C7FA6